MKLIEKFFEKVLLSAIYIFLGAGILAAVSFVPAFIFNDSDSRSLFFSCCGVIIFFFILKYIIDDPKKALRGIFGVAALLIFPILFYTLLHIYGIGQEIGFFAWVLSLVIGYYLAKLVIGFKDE